jgi:nucleolar protein 6
MSEKLSKRQKKALAFRNKNGPSEKDDEAKAIPITEDEEPSSSWLGQDTSNKRKRDDETEEPKNSSKKSKKQPKNREKGSNSPNKKQKVDESEEPAKKRYIAFIGNLPHKPSETLSPALEKHFPTPPISIRIPTKKTTNDPQGYAFLEFDSAPALEKALRCHHTMLLGRKINVELTAGGGGKSENRMGKIKERNKNLEEERRKRIEEEGKEKKANETNDGIHPDRLRKIKMQK